MSPVPLVEGWACLRTEPDRHATPEGLPDVGWRPFTPAGSVDTASGDPDRTDASDWWFRVRFVTRGPARVRLDGVATLAEGWVDGAPAFTSRSMFVPVAAEVVGGGEHELVVCCRALKAESPRRTPRPRWKTGLVERQDLRWIRTSLIGRIPGWSSRGVIVGPYRPVWVEERGEVAVDELSVQGSVRDGVPWVRVTGRATAVARTGDVSLQVGDRTVPIRVDADAALAGEGALPGLALWWPHTLGAPALHDWGIVVDGVVVASGRVGFRTVTVDRTDGAVRVLVNGRPVFCRGACWTGRTTAAQVPELRAAGLNMLRIGGTMTWGPDELYDACDEHGVLVWQDFLFANMDYPFADPAFRAEVDAEVAVGLRRLAGHACVAVYCGGSEVQQQAAMLGLPAAEWTAPFYEEALPAAIAEHHPGVPYFPSTPCEGPLPFSTSVGLTHYYGVGAYRRPLSDARLARVRFTPECLGFANVPSAENLAQLGGGAVVPPHHPAWKAGVPRDAGVGWDFDDVRDHYLAALFGVDPVSLRYADLERYLALSRVVTGELMLRVYAEWRRPGSGCGGALVWFLQDLRPGAGWGLLDSDGRPKAAWWALRRAWASRAVLLTDEGLDGVGIHVHNEHADGLEGVVELVLVRAGRAVGAPVAVPVAVAPHGSVSLSGDSLVGSFADLTYAYRFGPPRHDVVLVRLRVDGAVVHQDALFPLGHTLPRVDASAVVVTAEGDADEIRVTVTSPVFLQAATVALAGTSTGWTADDDSFHVAPDAPHVVRFRRPPGPPRPFKAHVSALNTDQTWTVRA